MSRNDPIHIAHDAAAAPLSAAQKKFNALVKKIDLQRQMLADWQQAVPVYQQRWHSEYAPLHAAHRTHRIELVMLLDSLELRVKLGKSDRATLAEAICDLVIGLMDGSPQDAALKALYNKHSGRDFDDDQREENDRVKAGLEERFGIDLGDDIDMNSAETVAQHIREKLHNAQEAEQHARAAAQRQRLNKRQQRQAEEAAQATRSVREVFRKLASALHPDREADPGQRQRKTELMQRVNEAYRRSDLLELLQLQLEIEQIDRNALRVMADERLKHYNKVLQEQLEELRQASADIEQRFKADFNLDPFASLTPQALHRHFQELRLVIEQENRLLQRQNRSLPDPKFLKQWLKSYRRQS